MSIEASGVQRCNQRFVRLHTYIHRNQRKIKYQGNLINGKQLTLKTGNQKSRAGECSLCIRTRQKLTSVKGKVSRQQVSGYLKQNYTGGNHRHTEAGSGTKVNNGGGTFKRRGSGDLLKGSYKRRELDSTRNFGYAWLALVIGAPTCQSIQRPGNCKTRNGVQIGRAQHRRKQSVKERKQGLGRVG